MKKKAISYWLTCTGIAALSVLSYQCTKSNVTETAAPVTTPDNGTSHTTTQSVTSFVHPGILNTQASLDFIRNEANTSGSARNNDYKCDLLC